MPIYIYYTLNAYTHRPDSSYASLFFNGIFGSLQIDWVTHIAGLGANSWLGTKLRLRDLSSLSCLPFCVCFMMSSAAIIIIAYTR
jgi:hypothetical protein